MTVDYYQRQIHSIHQELARLQEQKGRAVKDAAEEMRRANTADDAAARTTSPSSKQSKHREAQRHRENAAKHNQKVAELEGKIAREQGKLIDATKRRDSAQVDEDRRRTSAQADADRRRAAALQQSEREHQQRITAINSQLRRHDELHRVALAAIEQLRQLPERITVLFFASNPLEEGETPLRLAEEVREIGEMIRKSEHRDAVQLESRWAVQPLDVLQAINELQPRIVHFSGHGSVADEIIFQDRTGRAKAVSKEAIVQTIVAGSGDIQLVFFNTCYSRNQAEAVVEHVPAAIGMNASIGDDAARVFSAQFYSAIGFGHSVGRAFRQAKAALMLESIPEEDTPELFVTEGLDADDLVLVQPPARDD